MVSALLAAIMPFSPLRVAPKSGQSIDLREMPRPLFPHRPDFMAHEQTWSNTDPEEEALIYHSHKVLGVLYRAIRLSSREEDNQILKDAPDLDAQYVAGGEDDHVLMALIEEFEACGLETTNQPTDINDRDSAWYAMHTFASDLKHIAYSNTMNAGHPLSEHELFTGTILHGALPTKTKQELIQRINLQCKELIDNVLFRLEGQDGRLRPQEWTNRVLAALRVAVSQGGNFGAQTFGCIAIRSALYILALMKDLQQASGVVAAAFDYTGDQPFEPIISTSANLIGPSLLEDFRGEGELTAADATGRAFIDEDEGGEGVAWGNTYSIEKEDS